MLIQFTLQDLITFVAFVLGIAIAILLLYILWNIKKVVGIIRSMLETNQEFVNKTIKTMPGIFENVGQISSDVRETTDKLKISVPIIIKDVECATGSAKGSIELAGVAIENMGSGIIETVASYKKDSSGFMPYIHIIKEVAQIIFRAFSSKK